MISVLEKTHDCLRNQNCDPAKTDVGKAADQEALEAVGGNASKQRVYNISADIMPILAQQTGEDPHKNASYHAESTNRSREFLEFITIRNTS